MPQHLDYEKLKESFNKVAKHYDRVADLHKHIAKKAIDKLDLMTLQPERILEIGCGTGFAAKLLEKKYKKANIYMSDIAIKMLLQAKRKSKFFSRQSYTCADATFLPFPDDSFDFIFSNLTLHWCLDHELALKEWQRVLKPEGLLFFTTLGPDTLIELRQSWAKVDDTVHVNTFYDMHDIGDSLIHAGFRDPVMEVENFVCKYVDVYKLMHELKALGVHNINSERRKGLTGKHRLQKMLEVYQQLQTNDGKIPASVEVVYGHAWGGEAKTQFNVHGDVVVPIKVITGLKNP